MNKTIKIILLVAASVFVLAVLGAWYAASTINPVQLTQLLSASVKDATGRDLQISGPVSLKLFPSIGVTAEQVSLSNASWASDPHMLTLKRIEMDIKLFPLLGKRVEISRINLAGVDAHLQTNSSGDSNWDLTPPLIAAAAPPEGVATSNASNSGAVSQASSDKSAFVAVETVHISDARISYQDGKTPAKVISLSEFTLDKDGGKTSVLVELQYANRKFGLKGKVSSLRQAILDWNQIPTKMDVDLVLTVDGKALHIHGDINKAPQVLPQFNLSLESKSFNLMPLAGSAALAAAGGNSGSSTSIKSSQGKYFFSDDALPFDLLPEANGKISLNIAELVIPDQAPFTNLKAEAVFKQQQIEVNDLQFSLGKGSAQGQGSLSQYHGANPALAIKGMAQGFTWEQMIGSADSGSKVSGGQTQIALNIRSSGLSLHQMASKANGAVQFSVGPATLDTKYINKGGDLVITVLDAVNPMRKKSNQTVLECAVAYLPIQNGIINIRDSVGMETDRLNITWNGTVNLTSEAINLNIDPKEKSGLTTGLDLGGLVKLEGTIQHPAAGVNQTGVVNSAVSIGLGFLTGGLSIAAENAKSLATKTQPCKTALHSWSTIYPGAQ